MLQNRGLWCALCDRKRAPHWKMRNSGSQGSKECGHPICQSQGALGESPSSLCFSSRRWHCLVPIIRARGGSPLCAPDGEIDTRRADVGPSSLLRMLVMWGDGEGKTGDRKDGSDVDLQMWIFSDGSSRVVVHLTTTQTCL